MPRTRKSAALAGALSLLASCATATVDGLVPREDFPPRPILPSLKIVIAPGVQTAFPKSSRFAGIAPSSGAIFTPVPTSGGTVVVSTPTFHRGVPAQTVQHPLMYEVAEASFRRQLGAIFSGGPARHGAKLVCDVIRSEVSFGWPLLIPTALSLGVLNLLGMPGNYYTASVDVRVELQDADGSVIAEYRALGGGTAFSGLYWSYSPNLVTSTTYVDEPFEHTHASIAAKAYAIREALREICARIEADRDELRPRLTVRTPEPAPGN